jgi:hypothetical protein
MSIKNSEMLNIKATNPQSALVLHSISNSDYTQSISLLQSNESELKRQISQLQSEKRLIENSLVYSMITRKFFGTLSDSYQKYKTQEKVYIESLSIERKSKIEIDLYTIPLRQNSTQFQFYTDVLVGLDRIVGKTQNQSQQMVFMDLNALKSKITMDTSKY